MIWKGGVEGSLMVVVAIPGYIVLSANIDDSVAFVEKCLVSGADERGRSVIWQQAEHVDRKGLVCVKVAIVGSNDTWLHLQSLCSCIGSHPDKLAKHIKKSTEFGDGSEQCGRLWTFGPESELGKNVPYGLCV